MNIPKRFLNKASKLLTVHQVDFDARLIFANGRIAGRRGSLAHALDSRVIDRGVSVFLNAGLASNQPNRRAVINRKLALQPLRDVGLIAEIENEGRDAEANGSDRSGLGVTLVMNLNPLRRWSGDSRSRKGNGL